MEQVTALTMEIKQNENIFRFTFICCDTIIKNSRPNKIRNNNNVVGELKLSKHPLCCNGHIDLFRYANLLIVQIGVFHSSITESHKGNNISQTSNTFQIQQKFHFVFHVHNAQRNSFKIFQPIFTNKRIILQNYYCVYTSGFTEMLKLLWTPSKGYDRQKVVPFIQCFTRCFEQVIRFPA